MDINDLFATWVEKTAGDQELQRELLAISGDEPAIRERFAAPLKFGTAGMRAMIGAGTGRINLYTVAWATQAFAEYILAHALAHRVAIAYDCRNYSLLFAREAASVFAANGIRVYLFPELAPTPLLSFAVRELACGGGVVITASHNSREYNGYKCYDAAGCQINDTTALEIQERLLTTDIFAGVKKLPFDFALESGLIEYIDSGLIEKYYRAVLSQAIDPGVCGRTDLKVLYTPLNGTGRQHVPEILRRAGIVDIDLVEEQADPDCDFTTCPYPNPETEDAFARAFKKAAGTEPDLILATDPDCDRLGAAVRTAKGYALLNGNETGCLLTEYILSARKRAGSLPEQPFLIRTVATGKLVDKIAAKYGCQVRSVHTGFKNIGAVIGLVAEDDRLDNFIIGYEESHGYLTGSYARDKDAVLAALLVCEMACYYKAKGRTLDAVLADIYLEHGYYLYAGRSYQYSLIAEQTRFMDCLRACPPRQVAGQKVETFTDYRDLVLRELASGKESAVDFRAADLLSLSLADSSEILIRPSGTEPKLKVYFTAYGRSHGEAARMLDLMKDAVDALWLAKNNPGEKD